MRVRAAVVLFAATLACSNAPGDGAPSSSVETSARLDNSGDASVNFTSAELLGRPTDHSVALKAIASAAVEAYVEYGTTAGTYTASTAPATFADGAVEIVVDGLAAHTRYYYRLRYRAAGSGDDFSARDEHRCMTQRAAGETFVFDVQSDSHQGYAAFYDSALYGTALDNVASDAPDLFFDLGDAVSTDDDTETADTVDQKYQNQRTYFDRVGHSSAIFLVLGNHENEEGWNLDDFGTDVAASLPILGANGRKHYFLNPVPDAFYTGNGETVAELDGDHLRGDYYAFEWGDALFVAIDPYWYTLTKPFAGSIGGEKDDEVVGNRWDWTLGRAQYDWLAQTLAASEKPFKFVLAHHATGGTADYIRGGARGAKFCEWGGYDIDGTTYAFDTYRPGWPMPVHNLLVQNGVTAFIHGHDHVFAKEELDGIVYQECPQPADDHYGTGFNTNASDYAGATLEHNSGHLRFTVSPLDVKVEYVRAFLAGDGENGSVGYSYTISPCAAASSDGRACTDENACTTNDTCMSGTCVGVPTTCVPSTTETGGASSGGASSGGATNAGGATNEGGEAGELHATGAGQGGARTKGRSSSGASSPPPHGALSGDDDDQGAAGAVSSGPKAPAGGGTSNRSATGGSATRAPNGSAARGTSGSSARGSAGANESEPETNGGAGQAAAVNSGGAGGSPRPPLATRSKGCGCSLPNDAGDGRTPALSFAIFAGIVAKRRRDLRKTRAESARLT